MSPHNRKRLGLLSLLIMEGVAIMNQFRPLPIMKLWLDKSLMTYFMNFGTPQVLYSNMWLIEGPKQKIIVDTGVAAETMAGHGYLSEQIQFPDKALASVGLEFSDIDLLILTHLHLDHVGYAKNFEKAQKIIQRKEYEFAMNPHPMMAGLYVSDMFAKLKNIEVVDGDVDIVPGVKVLLTPGHTPGSQSVQIASRAGKVVLSGLCTIQDNFYPPDAHADLQFITPGIHTDALQAYDSMRRIKAMSDISVPLHDEDVALKQSIP